MDVCGVGWKSNLDEVMWGYMHKTWYNGSAVHGCYLINAQRYLAFVMNSFSHYKHKSFSMIMVSVHSATVCTYSAILIGGTRTLGISGSRSILPVGCRLFLWLLLAAVFLWGWWTASHFVCCWIRDPVLPSCCQLVCSSTCRWRSCLCCSDSCCFIRSTSLL